MFNIAFALLILWLESAEGSTWYGPFNNHWGDQSCGNVGWKDGNLQDCQEACSKEAGCNAINTQFSAGGCVLRACPEPIPLPTDYYSTVKGYTIEKKGVSCGAHRANACMYCHGPDPEKEGPGLCNGDCAWVNGCCTDKASMLISSLGVRNVDCQAGHGNDYRGEVSLTKGGLECQAWNVKTPHSHTYHVGAHNHCRNPTGGDDPAVWCYTTSPGKRWDFCPVKQCTGCYREKCKSYHKKFLNSDADMSIFTTLTATSTTSCSLMASMQDWGAFKWEKENKCLVANKVPSLSSSVTNDETLEIFVCDQLLK